MQTTRPTDFKTSIFEAKHAPTHEDSINVQHQQSSKISRLDHEQLDGPSLPLAECHKVIESISNELEETPCMDLSKALKGKYKRGKNMIEEETLVLLSCKVEGGRFCKGSGGATHWNLISEDIEKKLGSQPSADQCRLRYDTLLKAYKTYKKHCMKIGKTFSTITKEEQLDLKVATTLCEEWYTTIGKICDKVESRKRIKLNLGACNDLHPLSSHGLVASNPPPISNGRSFEDGVVMHVVQATLDSVCGLGEVALCNFFPMGVLSSLSEDLQSTLLNLVQECNLIKEWLGTYGLPEQWSGINFDLERVCQRLAILQDREERKILNYVFKLWELKFVSVANMVFEEGEDLVCIDLWKDKTWLLNFWVFEEISKEVLCKNPHLKTYYSIFPIEQSSLQYVNMLSLDKCCELKHLDLKKFPNLRFLAMEECPHLNLVTGWEVATSLRSIEILWCPFYCDFPNLRCLFSLKEFKIVAWGLNEPRTPLQLSQFSQCAKLQRLNIGCDESLSEIVDLKDLKDLKFLEFLSLGTCSFSNIQGLSGLQALKTLHLRGCESLRRVPDLGCLKGLTKLDMSYSGVEDVLGVGELHLLTSLHLGDCESLKWLPFLGHLKALVYLNLKGSSVKEILGREGLD